MCTGVRVGRHACMCIGVPGVDMCMGVPCVDMCIGVRVVDMCIGLPGVEMCKGVAWAAHFEVSLFRVFL